MIKYKFIENDLLWTLSFLMFPLDLPENIRKLLVLRCFERDRKGTFGNIRVKTSYKRHTHCMKCVQVGNFSGLHLFFWSGMVYWKGGLLSKTPYQLECGKILFLHSDKTFLKLNRFFVKLYWIAKNFFPYAIKITFICKTSSRPDLTYRAD